LRGVLVWRWQNDIIYMANTRIPIDTVIARYSVGDTPAEIHEGFPTLKLEDIYFAIGYYLGHREEMDRYMRERDAREAALIEERELLSPTDGLREKLLKRLEDKKKQSTVHGRPRGVARFR